MRGTGGNAGGRLPGGADPMAKVSFASTHRDTAPPLSRPPVPPKILQPTNWHQVTCVTKRGAGRGTARHLQAGDTLHECMQRSASSDIGGVPAKCAAQPSLPYDTVPCAPFDSTVPEMAQSPMPISWGKYANVLKKVQKKMALTRQGTHRFPGAEYKTHACNAGWCNHSAHAWGAPKRAERAPGLVSRVHGVTTEVLLKVSAASSGPFEARVAQQPDRSMHEAQGDVSRGRRRAPASRSCQLTLVASTHRANNHRGTSTKASKVTALAASTTAL